MFTYVLLIKAKFKKKKTACSFREYEIDFANEIDYEQRTCVILNLLI